MISLLRRGLIYKDISPDIVEHDDDIDADSWVYDEKEVYRGSIDPRYTEHELKVYWLYDENLKRIGMAEHEESNPEDYRVLWFRENGFATLYQTDHWVSTGKTLWSKLSQEAYSDCLEDDFNSVFDRCLTSKYRLVTPLMIIDQPKIYECQTCKKRSIKPLPCKDVIQKPYFDIKLNYLFIDDSFVIYEYVNELPQSASYEKEQQVSLRGFAEEEE